jgi:hypothetical protein
MFEQEMTPPIRLNDLNATDQPFYRASAKRGIDFPWEYSSNSGNPLADNQSKAAFFLIDQNFAFSGVIRLPYDTFEFHSLHQ